MHFEYRPPQDEESVSQFNWVVNFYRRYIPDCAKIIAPVTELTKSRAPNEAKWGNKQEKAFTEIKQILSSEPILRLPDLNRVHFTNRCIQPKSRGMPITGA